MRREQGFTLPELLVVIAIIVIMTGLTLPNWRSGERTLALDRVVHKAGQDVRRVQELALRVQDYTCAAGGISGYGIAFDTGSPESYVLFAECNGSNTYDAGTDGIVETVGMESGIEIFAVSLGSAVSIVFIPPTPQVFVNGESGVDAQVSFRRKDGAGSQKTLDISNKGVIDVN